MGNRDGGGDQICVRMTEKVWGDLECHLDIVQRMALPGLDETLQDAECDIYVLTTVMGLMQDGRWTNL